MKIRLAVILIFAVSLSIIYIGCNSSEYTTRTVSDTEIDTVSEMENAQAPVSLETFQDSLSGYGEFISIDSSEIDPENSILEDNNNSEEFSSVDNDIYYNYIWVPNSSYLYEGWSPYGDGRWVWTDWGWTWVSDYSWGWAPYHYGRWWYSQAYGWVWSPGRRWGPGWVNWCNNSGYIGWYPISPRVHLGNAGISTVNHHYFRNGWVVINKSNIMKHVSISTIVTDEKKNEVLNNATKYVSINRTGKKLINTGPDINEISNITGKKIVQTPLTEVITFHVPKSVNKNITNNNTKKKVDENNKNYLSQNNKQTIDAKKNTPYPNSKTNVNSITSYNTSKTYNTSETYNKSNNTSKTNTNQNNTNKNVNSNKNENKTQENTKKIENKSTDYNHNNTNKSETTNKTGNTCPKIVPGPKVTSPPPKVEPPAPKQSPPQQKQVIHR